MNPQINHFVHQIENHIQREPRLIGGIAAGAAAIGITIYLIVRARRPTAQELERRRREYVGRIGRITDGLLTDARTLEGEESISPTPEVLFYSYRLAGVTYNCAQDVSTFPELVTGYRIDQPVQIRYDIHNPGNSILLSETWSGLRQHPKHSTPSTIVNQS